MTQPVYLWPYSKAPSWVREQADVGGDEDWVFLIPKPYPIELLPSFITDAIAASRDGDWESAYNPSLGHSHVIEQPGYTLVVFTHA